MAIILDGTLGETFPSWTTAGRPATPAAGQMGYNTTIGQMDIYTASGWTSVLATTSTSNKVTTSQLPTGTVLQVVQTAKTDTFSTTSSSFTDVTGLSVSITPTSASNKILVLYTTNTCADASSTGYSMRLVRDATAIFVGDAAGSRPQAALAGSSLNVYDNSCVSGHYLDSPATTSAVTYKVQVSCTNGSPAIYVNRTIADRNTATYDARMASSIIVMEVAG